ncbi:MAG TPA: neocarzinostatin apoprotein domain-containing protein [Acidimicrobiales bacterium]|nr:neocarzinostatin apoprotein domain-containing protein [Acidimicrobiales bacterium]
MIDVSQTDGLRDGADLVVTGAGFVPGETVQLGVCVLGGISGYELCWLRNQIRTVAADPDGTFATTITATRYVKTADGPGDCRTDPYGCRVLVRANRSPNDHRSPHHSERSRVGAPLVGRADKTSKRQSP